MQGSHDVVWTREKIAANWEFFWRERGDTTWLFGKHAGGYVVDRADQELGGLRDKRVLDFRAGPGDLLAHLFDRGIAAQAVEPSEWAVEAIQARYRGQPLLRGVTRSSQELPAGSFDVVLLVEVIEHLLDEDIAPTLAEVRRLLAPGGAVFATAPNAENLASTRYRCPDCGGVFHQYQHLRSLTPESLAAPFEAAGFATQAVVPVYWGLSRYGKLRTWLRSGGHLPKPHLYYIGRAA